MGGIISPLRLENLIFQTIFLSTNTTMDKHWLGNLNSKSFSNFHYVTYYSRNLFRNVFRKLYYIVILNLTWFFVFLLRRWLSVNHMWSFACFIIYKHTYTSLSIRLCEIHNFIVSSLTHISFFCNFIYTIETYPMYYY